MMQPLNSWAIFIAKADFPDAVGPATTKKSGLTPGFNFTSQEIIN
jgi:hypothetical protein